MASPFPPDLMAALGGAQQQGPPPGHPAEISIPGDTGGEDPEQQVRDAIDQIRAAVSADGLDDQEKLILEQITTLGQKLLANRQSQNESAMGTTPAHKAMARGYGA